MHPQANRPINLDQELDLTALNVSEVVTELVDKVGVGVAAMIGAVKEGRYVRMWQEGRQPDREANLRAGLQAARVIVAGSGKAAAQRWFLGQNPQLEFNSPVAVLNRNTPEARAEVLRAAVGFIFH